MTTRDERAGFAPPSLSAAIELVTAMNDAGDDPGFFWSAVERVMVDGTAAEDPGRALAELVFSLSSLSTILLHHGAQAAGTTEEFMLSRIATLYCGRPAD